MEIAYQEALQGYAEGGVPIGGCLIDQTDGTVLGRGRNMRFQRASATLHGETAALENAGRLPGHVYKHCTLYTTLSPCDMCAGAVLLYGIPRCVVGENDTFLGAEAHLRARGVEVAVLQDARCRALMQQFVAARPQDWNEDIGL